MQMKSGCWEAGWRAGCRYYNPRTMDLNPEQQPSPSQRSSMSFSRWGWSETWRGTWAMSYINIYSSKGTRTPGYARCQFTSRYQVSYALSVWKIDFKNVCLPSIQVLVFKCHFPIKGTKIHGEMAWLYDWAKKIQDDPEDFVVPESKGVCKSGNNKTTRWVYVQKKWWNDVKRKEVDSSVGASNGQSCNNLSDTVNKNIEFQRMKEKGWEK